MALVICDGRLLVASPKDLVDIEFVDPRTSGISAKLPDTTSLRNGDVVTVSTGSERLQVILTSVRPGDELLVGRIYEYPCDSSDYEIGDYVHFERRHVYDIVRHEDYHKGWRI